MPQNDCSPFFNKRQYQLLLAVSLILSASTACVSAQAIITVTNNNNAGAGSLRLAINNINAGGTINFAPALNGATIRLDNRIVVDRDCTIDASSLSNGIVIDRSAAYPTTPSGPNPADPLSLPYFGDYAYQSKLIHDVELGPWSVLDFAAGTVLGQGGPADNLDFNNVTFKGGGECGIIRGSFHLTLNNCTFDRSYSEGLVELIGNWNLTMRGCSVTDSLNPPPPPPPPAPDDAPTPPPRPDPPAIDQPPHSVPVINSSVIANRLGLDPDFVSLFRIIGRGDVTMEDCIFSALDKVKLTKVALHSSGYRYLTTTTYTSAPIVSFFGKAPGGSSDLVMRRCRFEDNSLSCVYRQDGQATDDTIIEDCVFDANNLPSSSFGLRLTQDATGSPSPATLTRCTFSGFNSLAAKIEGPITAVNCTFSGNGEGALHGSSLDIRHCTIVDNPNENGAISAGSATALANHCLFANNLNSSGSQSNCDGPLTATYCLVNGNDPKFSGGSNVTNADPLLGPLADNGGLTPTHAPLAGSAALDAGDPAYSPGGGSPTNDQSGELRVQDSDGNGVARISIGSVEGTAPILVTTNIDEVTTPPASGTGLSLREAIAAASPGSSIRFHSSLNGTTINLHASGGGQGTPLNINKSVAIDAGNLAAGITITGEALDLVSVTSNASPSLHKLQLVGGRRGLVNFGNGGVYLTRITVRENKNNSGVQGAGIATAPASTLVLTNCLIQDNVNNTTNGGGIWTSANAHVILNGTCVFRNSANNGNGGGLWLGGDSTLNVIRSAIVKNHASGSGGGVYASSGFGTATSGNFLRATIGENRTGTGTGSGVFWQSGYGQFNHCTVFRNYPGGAFGGNIDSFYFAHNIIAENRDASGLAVYGGSGTPIPISYGYNLLDTDFNFFDQPSLASTDLKNTPARLSPLGWHGGRCPTYHPLAYSQAIDNGNPNTGFFVVDARDFFFKKDGDDNGSPIVDIGAVEAFKPVYVTTAADQNGSPTPQRSLREAIANIGNGGRILFQHSLSGATIFLTNGQINVNGKGIIVDATTLTSGITIDARNNSRGIRVQPTSGLSMHAVSITRGNSNLGGGAILNRNFTTLSRCALYNNAADGTGGGIQHGGPFLNLEHVTLSGNTSATGGGAIHEGSGGAFCIAHCTIVQNDVGVALGGAGGIQLTTGRGEMTHSILALNTGGQFANFHAASGILTSLGYNVESGTDVRLNAVGDQPNQNPLLNPLAQNGGFSLTHASTNSSPGINRGDRSFEPGQGVDQRGYARVVDFIDIGAYEHNATINPDFDGDRMLDSWEVTHGLDPFDPDDAELDNDGDKQINVTEAMALSNPNDANSLFDILNMTTNLNATPGSRDVTLTYTSLPGTTYYLFYSDNLVHWEFLGSTTGGAGSTSSVLVDDPTTQWSNNLRGSFIITIAP